MAIKIQSTLDLAIDSVKCVVYGGAGVGKTRLCATAPNPIIISAESGLLSLSEVSCDYIEINSLKELDEAYRMFKADTKYDTICLDSLSEIAEVIIQNIKGDYKDPRQAYGALADAMMPMLRKFRDLKGKNTIFTAKQMILVDEESGKVTEELMMPGKVLGTQIPYMVDELFHLKTDRKGLPIMQTRPERNSFAKDRSGALDPIEADLNMTKIFTKILNKRNK